MIFKNGVFIRKTDAIEGIVFETLAFDNSEALGELE